MILWNDFVIFLLNFCLIPKYSRLSLMMEGKDSFVNNCNVFTEDEIEEEIVEIPVEPIFYVSSVIGQGSLSDSFKITLHLDNTYSDIALSLPIGRTLFGQVSWRNSIHGMKFYIDTCTYSCGEFSIDLIKVRYDAQEKYIKIFFRNFSRKCTICVNQAFHNIILRTPVIPRYSMLW